MIRKDEQDRREHGDVTTTRWYARCRRPPIALTRCTRGCHERRRDSGKKKKKKEKRGGMERAGDRQLHLPPPPPPPLVQLPLHSYSDLAQSRRPEMRELTVTRLASQELRILSPDIAGPRQDHLALSARRIPYFQSRCDRVDYQLRTLPGERRGFTCAHRHTRIQVHTAAVHTQLVVRIRESPVANHDNRIGIPIAAINPAVCAIDGTVNGI